MKPKLTRRPMLGLTATLLLIGAGNLITPVDALAQEPYPQRAVRFVNNFPPGGPSDILARSVAQVLQEQWKQPFVVENKAGAGGNLGADAVAKSPADGYTVLFGIDTTMTVNPHIYKNQGFKPSDLKPLVIMASSGLLIGVSQATGIKSMADFLAAGKGRGLNLGSGGSGSPGHLAAEVLSDAAQVKITHIPYKGNTPAVTAVVAGEVDGGVLATPGMLPHVKSGRVTPLAVTSAKRSLLAPDVPTVAELGFKTLEQEVLYLAMVPAGTPEPVVQVLQKGILDALKKPDIQARLNTLDMHVEGQTGTQAAKRLADNSERYARIIKATGMKVD